MSRIPSENSLVFNCEETQDVVDYEKFFSNKYNLELSELQGLGDSPRSEKSEGLINDPISNVFYESENEFETSEKRVQKYQLEYEKQENDDKHDNDDESVERSGNSLLGSAGKGRNEMNDEEGKNEEREMNGESGRRNIMVLHPDHPHMLKFQKALETLLMKKCGALEKEARELEDLLKKREIEREETGVRLFHACQQVERVQNTIKKTDTRLEEIVKERESVNMNDLKLQCDETKIRLDTEETNLKQLQKELDQLNIKVQLIEAAENDVKGNLAVLSRAVKKGELNKTRAEEAKQQQDLLVERLVNKLISLTEECDENKEELSRQKQELSGAKEAFLESQMELEGVVVDRKRLVGLWEGAVGALKRRQEERSNQAKLLEEVKEKSRALQKEEAGIKKLVVTEQDSNELVSGIYSRLNYDISISKKTAEKESRMIEEKKKETYETTKMLEKTEELLKQSNIDIKKWHAKREALRKELERVDGARLALEDALMDETRVATMAEGACKYSKKMVEKIRKTSKRLENKIASIENDISKKTLEESERKSHKEFLKNSLQEQEREVAEKNEEVEKVEKLIEKQKKMLVKKMEDVEKIRKKFDARLEAAGGVEIGPLEAEMKSLKKEIEAVEKEMNETEKRWLHDQVDLVKIGKEKEEIEAKVSSSKDKVYIFTRKLFRIEGDIEAQSKEMKDIEKHINELRNYITRLNMKLGKEKDGKKDQVLEIKQMDAQLKDKEKDLIICQGHLEHLEAQKSSLLDALAQTQKQIAAWEKKVRMAEETKATVEGVSERSELEEYKKEIHRMEVRLEALKKQCARKVGVMEKLVTSKEWVIEKGEKLTKKELESHNKTATTEKYDREKIELERLAKQKTKEVDNLQEKIENFEYEGEKLDRNLQNERLIVKKLGEALKAVEGRLSMAVDEKYISFVDTLLEQEKYKWTNSIKTSHKPQPKSSSSRVSSRNFSRPTSSTKSRTTTPARKTPIPLGNTPPNYKTPSPASQIPDQAQGEKSKEKNNKMHRDIEAQIAWKQGLLGVFDAMKLNQPRNVTYFNKLITILQRIV